MALQKEHDIFDFLLLLPALLDIRHPARSDARHFQKPLRGRLDDFQGVLSELLDNPAGELGPDALYQAAAQVLLHSEHRGGQGLLTGLRNKLTAIFRVHAPGPAQGEDTAHVNFRHLAYHRHRVLVPFDPAL